jgi:hypothetical protein
VANGDIARRVESAVRAVLPRSVKVRVSKHDSVVDLTINGAPVEVKWVGEGGLRQVRDLLAHRRTRPGIVVARRMSPGAREALSEAGVGWIDETGAAEIVQDSLIISHTGRPDKPREKPPRWTLSVLAVAEALLCDTKATVAATLEATDLSAGSCTHALRVLTDLGFLISDASRGRGSARHIANSNQLLDAYAKAAAAMVPTTTLTVGVTWRDMVAGLTEAGRRWEKAGVAWVATGAVAASMLAPYLSSVIVVEVYVDAKTIASLEAVAAEAAERALVRIVHHYGSRPEFVVLGGLLPELLCAGSDFRHGGQQCHRRTGADHRQRPHRHENSQCLA